MLEKALEPEDLTSCKIISNLQRDLGFNDLRAYCSIKSIFYIVPYFTMFVNIKMCYRDSRYMIINVV